VITLVEREHDQWARQYLAAVLRRDRKVLIFLTNDIDPCRISAWGRLDALAAVARDLIGELTSSDEAAAGLSRRLVADALVESTTATDQHPG
jgi:hypothetical protein